MTSSIPPAPEVLHEKPEGNLKPIFTLKDFNTRARKLIAAGNHGALDYALKNLKFEDAGAVWIRHSGDNTSTQTETRTQKLTD